MQKSNQASGTGKVTPADPLRAAPTIALSLLLGVITTWIFYPGLMSFDSIYQYRQVIGDLAIRNYQPPVMVYIWKLGHTVFGPGAMLMFHQFLYWTGIGLIAVCTHEKNRVRVPLVLVMGLLPPLWINSATVWNDVGVTASFLFAVGHIMLLARTGARWVFVCAALALVYGLLAKRSALFAAVPLFFCLADAWFGTAQLRGGEKTASRIMAPVLAMGLFAAALLAGWAIGNLGVERMTKWGTIAVWDMAAVSLREERLLVPRSALNVKDESEEESLVRLQDAFEPYLNGTLIRAASLFPEGNEKELLDAWLALPLSYPGSYLGHRSTVFLGLLGTPWNMMNLPYQHEIHPNDLGLQLAHKDSRLLPQVMAWVEASVKTPFYKPWLYLCLLVATMAFALSRRGWTKSFCGRFPLYLGCSGLLYLSPLFFLAPATDFRYTLWMVASSVVLTAYTLFHRQ